MKLKDYIGAMPEQVKIEGGYQEGVILVNDQFLDITLSQKIANKSEGFSWGYAGSGPAQLSLAILLLYLPIDLAVQYYQQFKFKTVAKWPQQDIKLTVNLKALLSSIIYEQESKKSIL